MKLSRLELSGFKSFADTVTLEFGDGVTAIVGPNGCGKSNVSDAVRWVLGEQSARLLRGSKMEDVIFQGAASRRPVNVTEVSLFLDNSDGQLPVPYQEVVITRRLSRSGQSDYLLNRSAARLRDIQDLLRGTGLGSDAGVVIEAKMIDLLLSDRAEERRSLFEEAAGIGLYRDRKHSTERRLEETAQDLQRVEDLIAEVQSQIRSLARQKGKAERHVKLTEEKFAVQLTLARRLLDDLEEQLGTIRTRREELGAILPQTREQLAGLEHRREDAARTRGSVESRRTDIGRRLAEARVELGRLDGDLALAAERLSHAASRKLRATDERQGMEERRQQAAREQERAREEREAAVAERETIERELASRSTAEDGVRSRLSEQRTALRSMEEELQRQVQTLRSLEGERTALESDLASLRERVGHISARRSTLESDLENATARRNDAAESAERLMAAARRAAADADQARHLLGEFRRQEAHDRGSLREAQELVAQLDARRHALEELERDRVGLAPGAAALLAAKDRFGGAVLGPLSDYLNTSRQDAELAERLLGEWVHAVLVRDTGAVADIRRWHAEAQPGAVVLLPVNPGPAGTTGQNPLGDRLRAEGPAVDWVRALLGGSEAIEGDGHALRRANGSILLAGAPAPSGPLRRRAELQSLTDDLAQAGQRRAAAEATLQETLAKLADAETGVERTAAAAEEARGEERLGVAAREDAARLVQNLERELPEATAQLATLTERAEKSEHRLSEIDEALTDGSLARARLEEQLGEARGALSELEREQESAREERVHWQVQSGQIAARLQALDERLERAVTTGAEALQQAEALAAELDRLGLDAGALEEQQQQWKETRAERQVALLEFEAASADAEQELARADDTLTAVESELSASRHNLEAMNEEHHRRELEVAESNARRRSIVERVEAEWKKPIDALFAEAPMLDLDLETLQAESERIVAGLEQIGLVNPLAVEEHAEEVKRVDFLTTQRDDLVAGRQSLQQAIREIDGTARTMFLETFEAIQANFQNVFQTLFGGGECALRLANPDDPLESEIDIHAAPRGKRTQRIHLLSSGERTLVATSLLFSIYLSKPSPFCLMDEVDAPLDDSNVGRFTRLLEEFKADTQFIVITHNPRTMQSADAVYGVTMQEPGVSSIVGVRLHEHSDVNV